MTWCQSLAVLPVVSHALAGHLCKPKLPQVRGQSAARFVPGDRFPSVWFERG